MSVQTFIPHEIIHLLRFISGSVRTDAEEEAWAVYVQNQVIYELNQSRGLNIPYRLDGSSKLSLPEGEGSGNDSYGELPNNYLYIEMPDADNIDQILKMTIPK